MSWKVSEDNVVRRLARDLFLFRRNAACWLASRRARMILAAGMHRSGSTWMFNAARLLLQRSGTEKLMSGWIGDVDVLKGEKTVILLKAHRFEPFAARHASTVLYSFRDIRDVLASLKRFSGVEPNIEDTRKQIRRDLQWRPVADFAMRYEDMVKNPSVTLRRLAHVLDVENYDADDILTELGSMSYSSTPSKSENHRHNPDNLLHKSHVTDGRHGSWHSWLSAELVQQIEVEFSEWLSKHNYPLPEHRPRSQS